jgi:hypothetical protein
MVDRYTKAVLSVIAAALVALVAQNVYRPSFAQSSGLQQVQICDTQHCADLQVATVSVSKSAQLGVTYGLPVVMPESVSLPK